MWQEIVQWIDSLELVKISVAKLFSGDHDFGRPQPNFIRSYPLTSNFGGMSRAGGLGTTHGSSSLTSRAAAAGGVAAVLSLSLCDLGVSRGFFGEFGGVIRPEVATRFVSDLERCNFSRFFIAAKIP